MVTTRFQQSFIIIIGSGLLETLPYHSYIFSLFCYNPMSDPQVVLLSARNALLARLTLAPTPPSEDAARRFTAVAFGTSACRRGAPKASAADTAAAATAMLEDSGILDLESKVLGFLFSHAGAVKLMAGLDDVVQLLQVRKRQI